MGQRFVFEVADTLCFCCGGCPCCHALRAVCRMGIARTKNHSDDVGHCLVWPVWFEVATTLDLGIGIELGRGLGPMGPVASWLLVEFYRSWRTDAWKFATPA